MNQKNLFQKWEIKPEHKGQVELYLKWIDKYERAEGKEPPVAIILCATKSDIMTEPLELGNSGIHVAQLEYKKIGTEFNISSYLRYI